MNVPEHDDDEETMDDPCPELNKKGNDTAALSSRTRVQVLTD